MATEPKKFSPVAVVVNVIVTVLFFPALMLLLGGNWRWVEGWIIGLWIAAMIDINVIYLYFKDPALLAERSSSPSSGNQKAWDKVLIFFIFGIAIAWLLVLPLDAERFHWSPSFPLWLKVVGGVALIPALYLIERATIDNTFLSTRVRIQGERKQRVITTGVYGFVRHPLYRGCVFMMFGAALLAGSVYGLILSCIGLVLVGGRIIGEESMLAEELEGYDEYKQKVRYRLIPFVW